MNNLAHTVIAPFTVAEARGYYDGCCIEFVGEVMMERIPGGRLAYFLTPGHATWRYHAAFELNGIIHDLWQDQPMPLEDFMRAIGADEVEYPAEEMESV